MLIGACKEMHRACRVENALVPRKDVAKHQGVKVSNVWDSVGVEDGSSHVVWLFCVGKGGEQAQLEEAWVVEVEGAYSYRGGHTTEQKH